MDKEKHYAFYVLNERLKEYQQNLVSLNSEVERMKNLNEGIKIFDDTKLGEEMFVNLGHGIFIKAELKDGDLLMNVGEGILVKKSKKNAIEIVNKQVKEMEEAIENLKVEAEEDIKKIEVLRKEIEKDNK